jgi:hypothetical protein
MGTPWGQYFNYGRWDIILQPQENKMQLKLFACPTGKFHSAYSPYALYELILPNSVNIEKMWKKFKILSFCPG